MLGLSYGCLRVPKLQKAGIGTLGEANTTGGRREGQTHIVGRIIRKRPEATDVRMTQTVMPSVNSNMFLRQYQYCNRRKVRLTFLTRLSETDHNFFTDHLFSQALIFSQAIIFLQTIIGTSCPQP